MLQPTDVYSIWIGAIYGNVNKEVKMIDIFNKLNLMPQRDQIVNVLNEFYPNGIYADLGVLSGTSYKLLYENCNPKLLIGIDIFEDTGITTETDGQNSEFYKNIEDAMYAYIADKPNCRLIKGRTAEVASQFEDNFFDYIYIDADHSYEGVKKDLNAYWPKVKPGGILGGHDYMIFHTTYDFGVVQAVDEFKEQQQIKYFYVTPEGYPSWYIIKDN
jgi:predicted O-methyltransferase YrrM